MSNLFKRQDPTKLQAQLATLQGGGGYQKDEKEWKPTLDSAGNGSAVIRFLPARSDDELAIVKLVTHGIKQNNQWFINNCPSTHGDYDGCPVCKYISEHDLFEKAQVKGSQADVLLNGKNGLKRGTGYWANILVIKDPSAPANEGKVFKYRFGKKIYDKILAKIKGDESLGELPQDVTCPFAGSDFAMKLKKVSGFTNYDDCSFRNPSEIVGINDQAVAQGIFDGMSDLRPIVSKDKFKSFEELNKQFLKVMGGAAAGAVGSSAQADLDKDLDAFDKELKEFNTGTPEKTSGGGVQTLNTENKSLPEDDDVPFDIGDGGDGMDDLDALLRDD